MRCIEGREDVAVGDVKPGNVAEKAVVGFGRYRQRPKVVAEIREAPHHPFQGGMMGEPDREGVGDRDRPHKPSGVADPVRAGQFPIAVEGVNAGPNGVEQGVRLPWEQGGDARANAVALDQGREASRDAGNVGDGVERPGVARHRQTEPARSGAASRAEGDRVHMSASKGRHPCPAIRSRDERKNQVSGRRRSHKALSCSIDVYRMRSSPAEPEWLRLIDIPKRSAQFGRDRGRFTAELWLPRARLGRLVGRALGQLLDLAHVEPTLDHTASNRLRVLEAEKRAGMTGRELPGLDHRTHARRQLEKPDRVGDMAPALADHLGEVRGRITELGAQPLVAARFLHGVEVRALHVLDDCEFQRFLVVGLDDHDRHLGQLGLAGRPPASLAGNDLVDAGRSGQGADDDRLEDAFFPHGGDKVVEIADIEADAWVAGIRVQRRDRHDEPPGPVVGRNLRARVRQQRRKAAPEARSGLLVCHAHQAACSRRSRRSTSEASLR